jgi:flagellar biogenesis protein FliO
MLHTLPLALALLAQASESSPFGGNAGPDLTRYFTVCGLLLASILALAWGFRKLMRGALQVKAAQRSLQVLDVLPLSGKHKLAVVRCYDRTFALGLGEREVGLIAELDPVAAPARAGGRPTEFADALTHERVRDAASQTGASRALARVQSVFKRGGVLG